ncbi:hypothetical protein DXT99_12270 [Pontibacter diazotrophicus]|uniref:Uncharacterized protein n=1 Tax=Pontibacter diazotrophicus TaxID=1400979 RepID=A0A3D8LBC8_9BACT|nr:DUF2268 domain-containing putative Zn-dependent protease [Pontibacter diazotrophicus]RDV14741.1 hypothetical protein DXT99_12270 [Pontibacter diazotrophicus]
MKMRACLLMVFVLAYTTCFSQNNFEVITSDVDLFWKAFAKLESAASKEDSINILEEEYIAKGSPGVSQFTPGRIRNAAYLQKVINTHPAYYTQLREHSHKLKEAVPKMEASYKRLQQIYPATSIPRVYFVIGAMNSAGTIADDPVIGVDMFGLYPTTPTEELSNWHKAVLKPMDQIDLVVMHEIVHILQSGSADNSESLLSKIIGEGAADFVSALAASGHINKHFHSYGDKHEKELWEEFKVQMAQKDLSNWLYNGEKIKDRPADLGYYMGYKICEAYYNSTKDKQQAIYDILNIKDYNSFMEKSGYALKFNQ